MNAALYARKSTQQDVSEDAKSVTRQVELARAFAMSKGWEVLPDHVFIDDGISGALASKLVSRSRMIAAGERGEFDVLVVRDLDRLSRDDREAAPLVYALDDLGVEVWCYTDGQRVNTSSAMHRGMLSMRTTFAAAEREQAQARTREAYRSKAGHGFIAGGRLFGYDHVGTNGSRKRVINEAQAQVVRRVFQLVSEGYGTLRIANLLNKESIPGPNGKRWAATSLRRFLDHDLYRGKVVACTTQAVYKRGKKTRVPTPRESWIIRDAPELRIVSDELWKAAHLRLARTTKAYARKDNGQLVGRPSGVIGRHLLTGHVKCGTCGSNMFVGSRARLYLICQSRWKTGRRACSNRFFLRYDTALEAILATIKDKLLKPEVLQQLHEAELARVNPAGVQARKAALEMEIKRLDGELARLVDLAVAAGDVPAVATRLKDTQSRRDQAAAQLDQMEVDSMNEGRWAGWIDMATAPLEFLRSLLDDPRNPEARRVLEGILVTPITITPVTDSTGKLVKWEFSAEGDASTIIRGILDRQGHLVAGKNVAPGGSQAGYNAHYDI